ncbi:putative monooxygenase [Gordonia otitidis NBRC 100426]|uniref:Monooxygenase n=2 Tax=Gordonia otitidis TaxID=249058 RepID=H5TTH8_GORO1|nr:bifunctional 3-(3-hydroxy-phenyl)propionate/3-hydroxycinnamic acid hydroxylase [Gordonia otitidis]GAB36786.1 putative monooxygenase [Gordonia otitidis NBRC 100426]
MEDNTSDRRRTGRTSDVLIVGAGPVGLTTALYLAQYGWKVTVLERWPEPYAQPRAVHYDDETARLLARAGLRDRLADFSVPAETYEWQNADRDTLLCFDWSGQGESGWPRASMFNQPLLEAELVRAAEASENITIRRGHEAVGVVETDDSVVVTAHGPTLKRADFTASYVIGCDGANSFVRAHMPTAMTDLGFFFDWLIVDVLPREERVWDPINLQICDPARPTTAVSGGPGRRRWEFMRMPGETIEDLNTEDTAWELLAPWDLNRENSILERHAVYTFQARWADEWRSGRMLLAGDAAHQMPPFAGQGMCSGIRDAANLSFKLDLVLRGLAADDVLDSYGAERSRHVRHAIELSIELGKVICVTDPDAVAERDTFMLAQGGDPDKILPPLPPATLTDGLLYRLPDGSPGPGAGNLSAQGRLIYQGRTEFLDDVVGTGFILATTIDARMLLSDAQLAFLDDLGAKIIRFVDAETHVDSDDDAVDLDGTYLPHMSETGHVAALVRPDHYLFGVARSGDEIGLVVDALRDQLGSPATTDGSVGNHADLSGRVEFS